MMSIAKYHNTTMTNTITLRTLFTEHNKLELEVNTLITDQLFDYFGQIFKNVYLIDYL